MTDAYVNQIEFQNEGGTVQSTHDIQDIDHADLARIDGAYEGMTVGNAEQLVSTVGITDEVPYNFRTSGGTADIGDREEDKIVGGTVSWNQLIQNGNFADTSYWMANSSAYGVFTVNDNIAEFTVGASSVGNSSAYFRNGSPTAKISIGHVYLGIVSVKPSTELDFRYMYNGAASGTKSTTCPAGAWTTVANIIKCIASTNGAIFYYNTRNNVHENDIILWKNAMSIDLTAMFGSTIADYIYSLEQANAGAGVAWFRKLFPKPYYAYNPGELLSVNTSAHNTVGFNQFDADSVLVPLGFTKEADGSYYLPTASSVPLNSVLWENKSGYEGRLHIRFDCKYNSTTSRGSRFRINYTDGTYYTPLPDITTSFATMNATSALGKVVKNIVYDYGSGGIATWLKNICINLSWDGERDGEYEPYVKHTYPLDSSLTLRGIPKLDSANNLYYDGDVYASDGTVTRKYGRVSVDGVNVKATGFSSSSGVYYGTIPLEIAGVNTDQSAGAQANIVSDNYIGKRSATPGCCYITNTGNTLVIVLLDQTITSSVAANVYLSSHPAEFVYELATPTTEEAEPYASPQIVSDWGTEEYVDYAEAQGTRDVAIPVGHNTWYANNLRAKLEMSPDSPSGGDGDYIVRQTNGINEYVPLGSTSTITDILARLTALENANT